MKERIVHHVVSEEELGGVCLEQLDEWLSDFAGLSEEEQARRLLKVLKLLDKTSHQLDEDSWEEEEGGLWD